MLNVTTSIQPDAGDEMGHSSARGCHLGIHLDQKVSSNPSLRTSLVSIWFGGPSLPGRMKTVTWCRFSLQFAFDLQGPTGLPKACIIIRMIMIIK